MSESPTPRPTPDLREEIARIVTTMPPLSLQTEYVAALLASPVVQAAASPPTGTPASDAPGDARATAPAVGEGEVAEIRARCDAATEAPWNIASWRGANGIGTHAIVNDSVDYVLIEQPLESANPSADLVFAAHARSDIPRLLDLLAAATAKLAEATARLDLVAAANRAYRKSISDGWLVRDASEFQRSVGDALAVFIPPAPGTPAAPAGDAPAGMGEQQMWDALRYAWPCLLWAKERGAIIDPQIAEVESAIRMNRAKHGPRTQSASDKGAHDGK